MGDLDFIRVALPLTASAGTFIGAAVAWREQGVPPVVTQGPAKTPDVATAGILARAVNWAPPCWGPSSWFFCGVSCAAYDPPGNFLNAPWVLYTGDPDDGPLPLNALWAGVGPLDVGGSPVPLVTPDGGTWGVPPQGWSRQPLPRRWWLQTQIPGALRIYTVHLEFASLGVSRDRTTLHFPG